MLLFLSQAPPRLSIATVRVAEYDSTLTVLAGGLSLKGYLPMSVGTGRASTVVCTE